MFQQEILQQIQVNIHSSICIRGEKVIYIDPLKIPDEPHDADLILITHPHFDHFSPNDIKKLLKEDTVIAVPESMAQITKLRTGRDPLSLKPGQSLTLCGIPAETVAAYNQHKPAHRKGSGWLGYVLTLGETRVYITGDTDDTPESRAVQCDILLLPVSGIFTMNARQAAALTNVIRPHTVIPIHYGALLGGRKAPEEFRAAVSDMTETDIRDTVYNNLMIRQYVRILAIALLCGLIGYIIGSFL